jgi:hypothetical protein
MGKRLGAPIAVFCVVALSVVGALADSPHFQYARSSINGAGVLSVSFKEVGLGNSGVTNTQITLTVDTASATYQCWNNGGKHPQAGNKETVSHSLSITQTFRVRNGQTTGSISTGPPSPGSFSCPPGQRMFLMSVNYSGIVVHGVGGDSLEASPDPIGTCVSSSVQTCLLGVAIKH